VAGIGKIFLGDDAFGVEVVKRLAARKLRRRFTLPTLASAALILYMPCRMDTKPPSWWMPARKVSRLELFLSLRLT